MKITYAIGLMSGTSMDGVDAVLAQFAAGAAPVARARVWLPFADDLRAELIALNTAGDNELHRTQLAANAVSDLYGAAIVALLAQSHVTRRSIAALGAHGQTVRHRPDVGYTVQLLNGARLAERTGIACVCDFRARDVAAGGQGAPLAPGFHEAVFRDSTRNRAVLNLGGISNITSLPKGGNETVGFDCGPANVFLDMWCERHTGARFDDNGRWAASGTVVPEMLAAMLAEPWFALPSPKSTGRDLLSPEWLARFAPEAHAPADVQATLLALTVETVAAQARALSGRLDDLLVCGGGALNGALMAALQVALPNVRVVSTADAGVDPLAVEALAFAWLAMRALEGLPGNLASVTGAEGPRVLGAIYPA